MVRKGIPGIENKNDPAPLNLNPLQQLLRQQVIRRRRRAYAKKAKVKLPSLEEFKNKIMELPIAVSQ